METQKKYQEVHISLQAKHSEELRTVVGEARIEKEEEKAAIADKKQGKSESPLPSRVAISEKKLNYLVVISKIDDEFYEATNSELGNFEFFKTSST